MAKRIYGFVCDEALQKWKGSNGFNSALLVTNINQGAGVATQNVIEYFNNVAVIKDNRTERFNNFTGNNTPLYGEIGFIIDTTPPNDEGSVVTDDNSGAIPADTIDLDLIDASKWQKVFNIIEDCIYYRGSGNTTATAMLNSRFQLEAKYSGYIPGTIGMSSDTTGVTFMTGIEARTADNEILDSDLLDIPYWFEFGFNFGISGYEDVRFKLWMSEASFLAEYPLTTVTDVVLPCEPEKLATPSQFVVSGVNSQELVMDSVFANGALINNTYKENFKRTNTDNTITYTESSGVSVFAVRYFPTTYSDTNMKSTKFGVIYKGPEPSNELNRKAIRNKLLETDISEDTWRMAYPDLFSNAIFYLVPMWTNIFQYNGLVNVPVESGITKWSTFIQFVKAVFPNYNEAVLDAKLELLLNDASNLIFAVVPDTSNEANNIVGNIAG